MDNIGMSDGEVHLFDDMVLKVEQDTSQVSEAIQMIWSVDISDCPLKPEMLFEVLDMKPDYEKLWYYILLDELF